MQEGGTRRNLLHSRLPYQIAFLNRLAARSVQADFVSSFVLRISFDIRASCFGRLADGTADFGEFPSGLSLRVEDSRVERACYFARLLEP
jgi:hypothetical protein